MAVLDTRDENVSHPLVSIVIPTRNRAEMLTRLIKSILSSNYPNLEIIVVDDQSSDGTEGIIKSSFQNIRVIRNERRKLLAASRNVGIQNSKGEFVFLIDDDNVVEPNAIKALVTYMKSNEYVAISGPLTLYLNEPARIMSAGVKRNMVTSKTTFIGKDERDVGQYKSPIESLDLPNAFMIRRRTLDEVEGFNEKDFPIHYDEADLGERVRRMGYKIMVLPFAKVYHEGPFRRSPACASNLRLYYAMRNRIIFHRRHGRRPEFITFVLIFLPFFVFYNMMLGKVYPTLKGLIDGLSGGESFREVAYQE